MSSKTEVPPNAAGLRLPPLWTGLLSLAIILLVTPVLTYVILLYTDYVLHINWAIGLELNGHFEKPIPQFLYHVLLIGIRQFMPSDSLLGQYAEAAIVLGYVYYLCSALIVFYWLASASQQWISKWKWPQLVGLTLTIMFVSSINLFTWASQNLYLGYLSANAYQNPTILLSKPFALILFALSLRIFREQHTSYRTLFLCAVTGLLGTFAKPNYAMALLPAVGLVAAYQFLKKKLVNWRLLGAVFIPVAGALAWQLFFYQSDQAGGFEFAPFKVIALYTEDGQYLSRFLLSIAFPAAVYLLYYPFAKTRDDLNLAWLVFGVALVYAYGFAEKHDVIAGNFTWATQLALFILFALSVQLMIIAHTTSNWVVPRWKWVLCSLLLGLHLLGGLALYASQLRTDFSTWW